MSFVSVLFFFSVLGTQFIESAGPLDRVFLVSFLFYRLYFVFRPEGQMRKTFYSSHCCPLVELYISIQHLTVPRKRGNVILC